MTVEPITKPRKVASDDLTDARDWLEAWRDKRLENIDNCIASAARLRAYADEVTMHLLTRDAAQSSADGWDRAADRYRRDVMMMNRILEALA
jgi:hypothetical protein